MDIDKCIDQLVNKSKFLDEQSLRNICEIAKDIFCKESNLHNVFSPITVCGDVHGHFFDLLELFRLSGGIPQKSYLFLGDYVDRGSMSVETFSLLLCYKIKYPSHITLLRGNHESESISEVYGFYEEISRKYGNAMQVWKVFTSVFQYLPISCLIDGEILCLHGGLSPEILYLDQIQLLNRKNEIPETGPFTDIMWSDPNDDDDSSGFSISQRGAGWLFCSDVTKEFLHINNLSLLCRAHQLVQQGYKYYFDEKLLSVWSAPNYTPRLTNLASFVHFDDQLNRDITVFDSPEDNKQDKECPKNVLPYFL